MLKACGVGPTSHCSHWLRVAIHDCMVVVGGQPSSHFSPKEEELLLSLIIKLAGEPKGKFKALMMDCAKICNSEMTADSLLAYQI